MIYNEKTDYNKMLCMNKENTLARPDKNFIPSVIEVLGNQIEPKFVDGLVSSSDTLKAITNPNIQSLIRLLYETPRSFLLPKQKQDAYYGSLTPLVMYAIRKKHNLGYEAWDKEDPLLKFILGKFLQGLPMYQKVDAIEGWGTKYPSIANVDKYRKILLTNKIGIRTSTTSYKLWSALYTEVEEFAKNKRLNNCGVYMLLQIWVANSSLRCVDSMILDPYDWQKAPKAFDEAITITKAPKEIKHDLSF